MSSKQKMQVENQPVLQSYSISAELPFKIGHCNDHKERKYQRDGHWNQRQRLKYTIFLTYFRQLFSDPIKKKSVRIYDMMADMILTRTSNQCRSHHQKMEKYRRKITDIIGSVAEKYEPRVYNEMEEKYLVFVKVLLENREKYTRFSLGQRSYDSVKKYESKKNSKSSTIVKSMDVIASHNSKMLVKVETVQNPNKDAAKTADSYSEDEQQAQNREATDQIPVMTLQEQRQNEPLGVQITQIPNQNFLMCFGYQPNFSEQVMIPSAQLIEQNTQNNHFVEQQIRILQMKRQWHIQNAQILSAQLVSEKQLIQSCDNALTYYRQVLNSEK